MSGKQAKTLSNHQLNCLLIFACNTRNPIRDKLIVLLSVKAGLRAGEIAKLTWDMVLDPTGEIGGVIELRDCAAKKKSGRLIPINPTLRAALMAWREVTTGTGPIIVSQRGDAMRPVSIVNWFACAYRAVGLTARRTQAAALSSHGPPGLFTKPVARCATFSFWPAIGRFRPPSGISMATRTCSADWWR